MARIRSINPCAPVDDVLARQSERTESALARLDDILAMRQRGERSAVRRRILGMRNALAAMLGRVPEPNPEPRPSSSVLRRLVLQRDRGVCARCGFQAERVQRIVSLLRVLPHRHRQLLWVCDLLKARFRTRRRVVGLDGVPYVTSLWDVDHIIPRVQGGSDDLLNLRTLCIACHRAATGDLMVSSRTGLPATRPERGR